MTYHFKVKTGFGAMDFISIDETELAMAQRAMATGKIANFRRGTVGGNHIISITPDWHKELGYNHDYDLKEMDMQEIPRLRQREYQNCLEETNVEVRGQIENNQKRLT